MLRSAIIVYILFSYAFAVKLNRDSGGPWDQGAWFVFITAPVAVAYILTAATFDYLADRFRQ